eukprot:CAMPEP_0181237000 /NCGR_PEP_ID=MMETSP1096-20121128/38507_1 /TAXON_ID=156174 ORGANISM="Chrysochromulina ericina, Strain CCMP281" /NCGR_SAMPLE_ID=MMETSP1096 /ASSEMBLY_ACC=CAM_ASM_000453 /LENGTH=82 /DNA_ID=CAMNT_0023332281 /DNA_START=18 /DNA_END=263 /DNA_ORIENTATION=-
MARRVLLTACPCLVLGRRVALVDPPVPPETPPRQNLEDHPLGFLGREELQPRAKELSVEHLAPVQRGDLAQHRREVLPPQLH